jgi:hypothetical protein
MQFSYRHLWGLASQTPHFWDVRVILGTRRVVANVVHPGQYWNVKSQHARPTACHMGLVWDMQDGRGCHAESCWVNLADLRVFT